MPNHAVEAAVLLRLTDDLRQEGRMKKPETIFEQLYFLTTRVEGTLSDGSIATGTAFFFNIPTPKGNVVFLVTNKHVVEGMQSSHLTFVKNRGGIPLIGETITLPFEDFGSKWIMHPDKDVDICLLPFSPYLNKIDREKTDGIYFMYIDDARVPTETDYSENLDAIEEICFVGYPNNVYDTHNCLPVVRTGTVASLLSVDFEGRPCFLVDASVFPGSSGSPVFICKSGSWFHSRKKAIYSGDRFVFLGILSSVYTMNDINTLEVIEIPTRKVPIVETIQMIDLGVVFKSRLIKEFAQDYVAKMEKSSV